MGGFLSILFGVSFAGSVSFLILFIFQRFFDGYRGWFYLLMRYLLIFYFLPVFFFVMAVVTSKTKGTIVLLNGPDFKTGFIRESLTFAQLNRFDNIVQLMFLIWIGGVLICAFYYLCHAFLFIYQLRRQTQRVEEGKQICLFQRTLKVLEIRKKVGLYQTSGIISPFTTGIFFPVVVIPEHEYSCDEWELLFLHEVTHIKRRDVLFRVISTWVKIFHWFNPMMHWFTKEFFENSEMACDEKVIRNHGKQKKILYAELLYSLLERSVQKEEQVIRANFLDDEKRLKRRLKNFMKKKKPTAVGTAFLAALTGLLAVSCPVISYASASVVLHVQNVATESYLASFEEEEQNMKYKEYREEVAIKPLEVYSMRLKERGDNRIDITIEAGERYWIRSEITSDSIGVLLMADSSSDSFRVGYSGESSGRYINSSKGAVNHTFSLEPGEYDIYIENRSDHAIHISGRITV